MQEIRSLALSFATLSTVNHGIGPRSSDIDIQRKYSNHMDHELIDVLL